jgi:DNA mismatch endonuclease (patch repair protein)
MHLGASVVDRLTVEERSRNMSRIRGEDTKPEIAVRRLLHCMGYRFRLHRRDLPGRPDIALPKRRAVVFVHGCFWHRHRDCNYAYTPKSRVNFWKKKFAENEERDIRNRKALRRKGWNVIVVWECELRDQDRLVMRLTREIGGKTVKALC